MPFKRYIRILFILFTLGQAMPAKAAFYDGWGDSIKSAFTWVLNFFDTKEGKAAGIIGLAVACLVGFMAFTKPKAETKADPTPAPEPEKPEEESEAEESEEPTPPPASMPVLQSQPQPVPTPVPTPVPASAHAAPAIVPVPASTQVAAPTPASASAKPCTPIVRTPTAINAQPVLASTPMPALAVVPASAFAPVPTPVASVPTSVPVPVPAPVLPAKVATPDLVSVSMPTSASAPTPAPVAVPAPIPAPSSVKSPVVEPRNDNKTHSPKNSFQKSGSAVPALLNFGSPKNPASATAVASAAVVSANLVIIPASSTAMVPVYAHPFERFCADPAAARTESDYYKDVDLNRFAELSASGTELSKSMVLLDQSDIPIAPNEHLNAIAECQIARRVLITPPNVTSPDRIMLVCVHGTFSGPQSFGVVDTKPLTIALNKFARCLAQAHACAVEIVSFKWSGALSEKDRNEVAARALAHEIVKLHTRADGFRYSQLWSIAHSHGCNVVNRTAALLATTDPEKPIHFTTCIHIASPAPDDEQTLQHIKKLYHFYGSMDFTQGAGSIATTWWYWKRKYPVGRDAHSIRYNIRLSSDGIDLNHINIKVPVVAYLPQLIYMIETNYPRYCDLDANVAGDIRFPHITIRDAKVKIPSFPVVTNHMRDAMRLVMQAIKPTTKFFTDEYALSIVSYVGDEEYGKFFSDQQEAEFHKKYKRSMHMKPHFAYRMFTMLAKEARSKDVPALKAPTSKAGAAADTAKK